MVQAHTGEEDSQCHPEGSHHLGLHVPDQKQVYEFVEEVILQALDFRICQNSSAFLVSNSGK